MKSTRSRPRSKNNRNRQQHSGANVVNRVFDSSGPEGKVRGTPQQVIEKYNQLARDAQLNNDRVAAENFQQHAEHYLRMLSEAQREQDQRREEQERQNRERQEEQDRQNRERQAERDRERAERQERDAANGVGQQSNDHGTVDAGASEQNAPANSDHANTERPDTERSGENRNNRGRANNQRSNNDRANNDPANNESAPVDQGGRQQPALEQQPAAEIAGGVEAGDSGLVETPETKPKPKRAPRRKPKPKVEKPQADGGGDCGGDQPEAAAE